MKAPSMGVRMEGLEGRILMAADDGTGARVLFATPEGARPGLLAEFDFEFDLEMDVSSFSAAQDVASFTGPGATDLRPQIVQGSWLTSRRLRISFNAQTAPGEYAMTLGPGLLAAGLPMDQDEDGIAGEVPDDRFTARARLAPDGGFDRHSLPLAWDIDLEPGQAGVAVLFDDEDDAAAPLPLGSNTFNFYGVPYGGDQLFVSTNGLITFGQGNTDFGNSDLTDEPVAPAIAPLWDDWLPNEGGDVLYRFDDFDANGSPERLVIEWSRVPVTGGANGNGATFQAVLQLNTAGRPGEILFNYVDLDVGQELLNDGGRATAGIKADGDQTSGEQSLLVSFNNGDGPFVVGGQAVLVSTETAPPAVTAASMPFWRAPHRLKLRFNRDVSASLQNTDVSIERVGSDAPAFPAVDVVYDTFTNTALFKLTDGNGVLSDGRYRAVLSGSGVEDWAGQTLGQDFTFEFDVLAGDVDRDGKIGISDYFAIDRGRATHRTGFMNGDFNLSGGIANADDHLVIDRAFLTQQSAAPLAALPPAHAPDAPSEDSDDQDDNDLLGSSPALL